MEVFIPDLIQLTSRGLAPWSQEIEHHRPLWLPVFIAAIVMAVVTAVVALRGFTEWVKSPVSPRTGCAGSVTGRSSLSQPIWVQDHLRRIRRGTGWRLK